MKIWRVKINAKGTKYDERSEHLVRANDAEKAIKKACAQAKRQGMYKRYDAESIDFIGDAL